MTGTVDAEKIATSGGVAPGGNVRKIVCMIAVVGVYLTGLAFWNQVSGIAREAPNFQTNLTSEITSLSSRVQSPRRFMQPAGHCRPSRRQKARSREPEASSQKLAA